MRKFVKIDAREGCLHAHLFCMVWCEEEDIENLASLRYLYLRGDFYQTWYARSCIWSIKIYKFDRNLPNSFIATIG